MKIHTTSLQQGAKNAEGVVVIIDVFRACSTACYLFEAGVEQIFVAKTVALARNLKDKHPECILVGERGGEKIDGFNYGNSPSEIRGQNLRNRRAILTTSAGTKGLIAAKNSVSDLLFGGLTNLGATVRYIQKRNPVKVTLVAMGRAGKKRANEDEICAHWMKKRLLGEPLTDVSSVIEELKDGDGQRFFREETQDWMPKEDFYLCTDLNRFGFVIVATDKSSKDIFLRKS